VFDIESIRRQFPALDRCHNGQPAVFFDGPAGSQVPQSVADAISHYLLNTNANHGGSFATSRESDLILDAAHQAVADFLGADSPDCTSFGANMTTLTMSFARSVGQTWSAEDEVIVTDLDHDANVTTWQLAARDAGASIHRIGVCSKDCTLDLDDLRSKLSDRTKLVAVGYASNITGTINPIAKISAMAHEVGALVFVDAVHFAPHGLIDVAALGCDALACSAYKFFGPHVGVLWARRPLLESLEAYKLRPAPDSIPGKWMTGTQNHEGIAGVLAAIDYLANVGRMVDPQCVNRRDALRLAFQAIKQHEELLAVQLLNGLEQIEGVRVWGIIDAARQHERVPTVSFTHDRLKPHEIAEELAQAGIFVWPGNHYALPFTEAMDLEPDGTLRIGILHYNTAGEVARVLELLTRILQ
jgi:cysteine desulfurase family protein (TIGR01976 family)